MAHKYRNCPHVPKNDSVCSWAYNHRYYPDLARTPLGALACASGLVVIVDIPAQKVVETVEGPRRDCAIQRIFWGSSPHEIVITYKDDPKFYRVSLGQGAAADSLAPIAERKRVVATEPVEESPGAASPKANGQEKPAGEGGGVARGGRMRLFLDAFHRERRRVRVEFAVLAFTLFCVLLRGILSG